LLKRGAADDRESRRAASLVRRPSWPRILIAGSLYLAGATLEANGDSPR
jgi:hypothetical protein